MSIISGLREEKNVLWSIIPGFRVQMPVSVNLVQVTVSELVLTMCLFTDF
jgi:hypothetical protein